MNVPREQATPTQHIVREMAAAALRVARRPLQRSLLGVPALAIGLAGRLQCTAFLSTKSEDQSFRFVVCGAGTGGLAVASTLADKFGEGNVAVIEPADVRQEFSLPHNKHLFNYIFESLLF